MKDSTKSQIDAMTIDELSYQIELGRTSPYQRDSMAYIKSRYIQLKDQESLQRHHENIAAQKSSAEANKPVSPIINTWWFIVGGITLAALLFIFRTHLGITL